VIHWADFHGTPTCWTNFCKEPLYWIIYIYQHMHINCVKLEITRFIQFMWVCLYMYMITNTMHGMNNIKPYAEFHYNRTNTVDVNARSKRDGRAGGRTWCPHMLFFLLRKKLLEWLYSMQITPDNAVPYTDVHITARTTTSTCSQAKWRNRMALLWSLW
jgi:hypothetical protein